MTAPNVLEFDWTSNAYRSHVGDVEHSFDTLAAAALAVTNAARKYERAAKTDVA